MAQTLLQVQIFSANSNKKRSEQINTSEQNIQFPAPPLTVSQLEYVQEFYFQR